MFSGMGAKERRGVGVYVDAGRERDRGLECPIEDRDHRMVACHVYARDLREEEEHVGPAMWVRRVSERRGKRTGRRWLLFAGWAQGGKRASDGPWRLARVREGERG